MLAGGLARGIDEEPRLGETKAFAEEGATADTGCKDIKIEAYT